MKKFAAIWTAISLFTSAGVAVAADCRSTTFEDVPFTFCTADPATEDIRLFQSGADGKPLGTFDNVLGTLGAHEDLAFAMNGGMYHPDRRPVGLFIENGTEISRIVTRAGPGNFGLLPNGVLCLSAGQAEIFESREFAAAEPKCTYATQSGPMLVIDGALHPRFLAKSKSRNIRNGVGITREGKLVAAISDAPVNFHLFARFFRDILETPRALYLDGKVSRLYAPGLGRHDAGFPMGPILGIVTAN